MIAKFNPAATVVSSRIVVDEEQYLRLIRTLSTGEVIAESLIQVEPARNVCLRCLSHEVSIHPTGPNHTAQLICHSCNVRYGTNPTAEA
jgi:hypothetical protein